MHNLCMKYIDIHKLTDAQFKRLTGVSWSTYKLMVEILNAHSASTGRPPTLTKEDQLLLCLSYWREYRTLFHVGMTYGVSESTASRIVRDTEDHLIKSKQFNLPKKVPTGGALDWDVVIVDATEIPVQRPKKTEKLL